MKEIIFLVHEAEEGGYYEEAAGVGIFAEGDTLPSLKENIKEFFLIKSMMRTRRLK